MPSNGSSYRQAIRRAFDFARRGHGLVAVSPCNRAARAEGKAISDIALTPDEAAHAKTCPKCKPSYDKAMAQPRDALLLHSVKRTVASCMKDQCYRPRR
jgi:hypothetical protein